MSQIANLRLAMTCLSLFSLLALLLSWLMPATVRMLATPVVLATCTVLAAATARTLSSAIPGEDESSTACRADLIAIGFAALLVPAYCLACAFHDPTPLSVGEVNGLALVCGLLRWAFELTLTDYLNRPAF